MQSRRAGGAHLAFGPRGTCGSRFAFRACRAGRSRIALGSWRSGGAVRAFPSRLEVQGYLEGGLIESTAAYWSRFGAGRYAEAFEDMHADAVSPG